MADGYFRRNGILRPDYSDDITDGQVAWFALNERGGLTARDISGKSNHGTLTNGPEWGDGLKFDGTDDHISLPNNSAFNPGGAASWVVWFYTDVAQSGKPLFMQDVSSGADSSTYKWIAGYVSGSSTSITTYVRIGGTAYSAGGTASMLGKWSVYVGTFDRTLSSARLKTYFNGQLVASNNAANGDIDTGARPEIGRWLGNAALHFNGKVRAARMWNRVLSPSEIQKLTLNPDAGLWVPDATRYYVAAAGGTSGTGAISLSGLSVSGIGKMLLKGTGAVSLAPMTVSSAGKERFTGTGAANLSAMSVSGAGKERFTATGVISLSPMTSSTAGKEILTATGALTLSGLSVSGAGSHTAAGVTSGSGAVSLAGLQVSGVGKVIFKGTGTVSLSPAGVSATGKELFKATGNVTLAPLTASGAAKEAFKGVGAVSLAPFTATGAGKEILSGTAAITLRPLNVAGVGVGGVTPAQLYAVEIVVQAKAREIVVN